MCGGAAEDGVASVGRARRQVEVVERAALCRVCAQRGLSEAAAAAGWFVIGDAWVAAALEGAETTCWPPFGGGPPARGWRGLSGGGGVWGVGPRGSIPWAWCSTCERGARRAERIERQHGGRVRQCGDRAPRPTTRKRERTEQLHVARHAGTERPNHIERGASHEPGRREQTRARERCYRRGVARSSAPALCAAGTTTEGCGRAARAVFGRGRLAAAWAAARSRDGRRRREYGGQFR